MGQLIRPTIPTKKKQEEEEEQEFRTKVFFFPAEMNLLEFSWN